MNNLVEKLNDFFATRPGLLPMIGIVLVLLNLLLQIFPGPGSGWLVDSNLFLHLGVVVSVVSILLIRALS